MKQISKLALLALISLSLTPLASADTTGAGGDEVDWHCDHDSPDGAEQHDTYCYVIVGGQMFVVHTDDLHHGVGSIVRIESGSQASESQTAGPTNEPVGFGCEQDDDLDNSCWVWVAGQMYVVHFPRLDEAIPALELATGMSASQADAVGAVFLPDAGGCLGAPLVPTCEAYCRTHHDYGDCWITVGGFQYRAVLWRPCSTC